MEAFITTDNVAVGAKAAQFIVDKLGSQVVKLLLSKVKQEMPQEKLDVVEQKKFLRKIHKSN